MSAVVLDYTSLEGSFEVAGNPGSLDDHFVIILSLQFLRSFGGFSNAKSSVFWGSAPDPDKGASCAPPLGGRGAPLPHPPRDCSTYSQLLSFSAPPPPPPPPQLSRLDPLMKVGYGLSGDHINTHPAYVLVQGWDRGKPAAFDITVTSPLTPATLRDASTVSGAAVRAAEC